jgi:hypothetical protein
MGNLNNDFSRLTNEILSLRCQRETLRSILDLETKTRRTATALMCASFGELRAEAAQRMKAGRVQFLNGLRQTVAAQKRSVRLDLAGAQHAWSCIDTLVAPLDGLRTLLGGKTSGKVKKAPVATQERAELEAGCVKPPRPKAAAPRKTRDPKVIRASKARSKHRKANPRS